VLGRVSSSGSSTRDYLERDLFWDAEIPVVKMINFSLAPMKDFLLLCSGTFKVHLCVLAFEGVHSRIMNCLFIYNRSYKTSVILSIKFFIFLLER